MAARRRPQYESNAIDAQLDLLINQAAAPPPFDPEEQAQFSESAADLGADLDEAEENYQRRVSRALSELNRTGSDAIAALQRLQTLAHAGDTEMVLTQIINRNALPALARTAEARARVQGLEREAPRLYGQLCAEIEDIGEHYGVGRVGNGGQGGTLSPNADDIVEVLLRRGPFAWTDPRLGDVQVDPEAFVQAYGLDALVARAQEKIESHQEPFNPAEDRRAIVLDAFRARCRDHPTRVANQVREQAANAIAAMGLQASDIVPDLINVLGERGVRAVGSGGQALRALADALAKAFDIDVAIEVAAPQVDLDPYYAELYDACSNPYGINRARVAQLAEIVGVSPMLIAGLDARGICEAALQGAL
ncbi:hypothetical protein pmac_cds_141 [Pandoravirus macleodensis]|uniref:Uncharacterized protein n=1 Tax=Pandoravirus macleodensis TaxID=2107707 RepID=A0A2U7UED3_9VIRU|nr:hypothetical protein pmac_cds_141 [Pandoravirus macleodensis]AVK76829.1 hypothetical protein pmac_cds_141 [Pandoravirus macleodensis]